MQKYAQLRKSMQNLTKVLKSTGKITGKIWESIRNAIVIYQEYTMTLQEKYKQLTWNVSIIYQFSGSVGWMWKAKTRKCYCGFTYKSGDTLTKLPLHCTDEAPKKCDQRATGPVLTSVKKEKRIILSTILNFAVRCGKLRIYTPWTPSEVFWKFAPSGGYTDCAVICFT